MGCGRDGGQHDSLGLQGGWDAGDTRAGAGTDAGAQRPGNVPSMAGTALCCWPRAPAMGSALRGDSHTQGTAGSSRDGQRGPLEAAQPFQPSEWAPRAAPAAPPTPISAQLR